MTNDLIHEVEESIKRERMEKLWKEYGSYIIGAAVAIVLITAISAAWRSYNTKVNVEQTTALMRALDAGEPVAQLAGLAEELRPDHRTVAHLTAAGMLMEEGNKEEALKHYQAVAASRDADSALRDFGQLMSVRLEWADGQGAENIDNLLSRLGNLMGAHNPWRYHARIEAALILAHGKQDYAGARQHLAPVLSAENDLPATIKQRAQALDHVYQIKLSEAETQQNNAKEEPEG